MHINYRRGETRRKNFRRRKHHRSDPELKKMLKASFRAQVREFMRSMHAPLPRFRKTFDWERF